MNTFQLIKEYVERHGFYVYEEDEGHIVFRYQLNPIQVSVPDDGTHFISLMMALAVELADEDMNEAMYLCHELNKVMRQTKYYVNGNTLLVTAEIYHHDANDIDYQMDVALESIIDGKVQYKTLEQAARQEGGE